MLNHIRKVFWLKSIWLKTYSEILISHYTRHGAFYGNCPILLIVKREHFGKNWQCVLFLHYSIPDRPSNSAIRFFFQRIEIAFKEQRYKIVVIIIVIMQHISRGYNAYLIVNYSSHIKQIFDTSCQIDISGIKLPIIFCLMHFSVFS